MIRCWEDSWVPEVEPLKTLVSLIDQPVMNCLLKEMVTEEGAWNIQAFRERLLEEVVNKIMSIPPPHPLAGPDKIFWIYTSNKYFLVKSAYQMIKKDS